MRLLLAVKSVPFDEIVFVQYPVTEDPYDLNRVAPNDEAADQLWAALAANQPIQLTSDPNLGGGVITVDPAPTDPATPDPAATDAPTDAAIVLPDSISGQTAAQTTCSAGNVSG